MKKAFVLFLLFSGFWLKFATETSAHVLKSEGTVGAVMHISPQDDPAAREVTTLYLSFKDTADKMRLRDCDCILELKKSGEHIASVALQDDEVAQTVQRSTAQIVFPEVGVYELVVSGSPKVSDLFEPFTLVYPLRVARVSDVVVYDTQSEDETVSDTSLFAESATGQRVLQLAISLSGVLLMAWLTLVVTPKLSEQQNAKF